MDFQIFKKLDKELNNYIKQKEPDIRIGSSVSAAIIGSIEGLLNCIISLHNLKTINENSIRNIIEDGNTAMSKLFLHHLRSFNANLNDNFKINKEIKEYMTSQNKNLDPTGLNFLTFIINKFIVDLIDGSLIIKETLRQKTLDSRCILSAIRFMSHYDEDNSLAQLMVSNLTKHVTQLSLQNKTE